MKIGIDLSISGQARIPDAAEIQFPASTVWAITPDHMVFNGSDILTGFTNDAFGNSARTTITGTLSKGPNDGVLINNAQTNYLTTVLSEISGAYPTGHHVAMCYRRTETRFAGLLVGSTDNAVNSGSFVGSMYDGDVNNSLGAGLATAFGTATLRNYHFEFNGQQFNLPNGTGSTTRNTLHTGLYDDNDIKCVGFEDMRMGNGGGALRWFRFDNSAAQFHGKVEWFGAALCSDIDDLPEMMAELQRLCEP